MTNRRIKDVQYVIKPSIHSSLSSIWCLRISLTAFTAIPERKPLPKRNLYSFILSSLPSSPLRSNEEAFEIAALLIPARQISSSTPSIAAFISADYMRWLFRAA